MKLFFKLLILFSMCACASNKNKSSIYTLWISENKTDCQIENQQNCFLVQRNEICDENKWAKFNHEIIGFEYKEGTRYKIEIKEEKEISKEVLSTQYSLVKIISSEDKQRSDSKPNKNIHDIWALETMNGKAIDKKALNKRPIIEIHLEEKRIMGNDGCNNINGTITLIDAEKINIDRIMGTKMACPNMDISRVFTDLLTNVQYYKLENLKLKLYDQEKKEILSFMKID